MKNLILFTIIIASTLPSCSGKKEAFLASTSPDGQATVNVSAKRIAIFDPWRITLAVNAYGVKEGKLEFEVMADDINAENVFFEWSDNYRCLIVFKQKDGSEKRFQLFASPEQVRLNPI